MTVLRTTAELRARVRAWKAEGQIVGVVPTMGALHEGHLSLARAARAECERVVATIFVNPKQFNSASDLAAYPRTEEEDVALLAGVPVDAVFVPEAGEVYPPGHSTTVRVEGLSEPLEGAMRPGHFEGVATVVTKLFGMTRADRAYFGQKDWQQLQIVLKLVRDLNLPVHIVGCETVREADGLALSSRNRRLSAAGRARAPALFAAMTEAAAQIARGEDAGVALAGARAALLQAGFAEVDYLDLRDARTLLPVTEATTERRLLAAAWLDGVRLIDNIAVA